MCAAVYILDIHPWSSCGPFDTCKVCGVFPFPSCEVEWIDGEHYNEHVEAYYCPEMCKACVSKLIARECKEGFSEKKDWYVKNYFLTKDQVANDPRNA